MPRRRTKNPPRAWTLHNPAGPYRYRVTGPRGGQYLTTTKREAEALTRSGGSYVDLRAPQKRRRPVKNPRMAMGARYRKIAMRDYGNWRIGWWREAVQNAVDAGSRTIHLTAVTGHDFSSVGDAKPADLNDWVIGVEDRGKGMDAFTLINAFLTMGGSAKSGGHGGFGKAKELLILPWLHWKLVTGNLTVVGEMDAWDLYQDGVFMKVAGPPDNMTIRGPGDPADKMVPQHTPAQFYRQKGVKLLTYQSSDKHTEPEYGINYVGGCNLPGIKVLMNGARVKANLLPRGEPVRQWHTNRGGPGATVYYMRNSSRWQDSFLYVRTRSADQPNTRLLMFSNTLDDNVRGRVVVELDGPSTMLLTANRDSLTWDTGVRDRLEGYIRELAQSPHDATRVTKFVKVFQGTGKFRSQRDAQVVVDRLGSKIDHRGKLDAGDVDLIIRTAAGLEEDRHWADLHAPPAAPAATEVLASAANGSAEKLRIAIKQALWQPDMIAVSDVDDYKFSALYDPATMGDKQRKLLTAWTEVCRYVMTLLGMDREYGVGFIFSDQTLAEYRRLEGSEWLLINPFPDWDNKRRIHNPDDAATQAELWAAAIHEITHLQGFGGHDSAYAAAMTSNVGKTAQGFPLVGRLVTGRAQRKGGPTLVPSMDTMLDPKPLQTPAKRRSRRKAPDPRQRGLF